MKFIACIYPVESKWELPILDGNKYKI